MSDYTAWRITYQDAEKAAQAAFNDLALAQKEIVRLEGLARFEKQRGNWFKLNWLALLKAEKAADAHIERLEARLSEAEAEVMFERDAAKMAEMRADAAEAEVKRLTDTNAILEEQNKRLIDCYDIKASVSATQRAEDFSRWMGKPLTRYAKKELAKHFEAHGLASGAKCDTGNT